VGARRALRHLTHLIPYRVKDERLELIAVFHGRQKWPLTGSTF
jgi:plasmid stabilization system protein ParE